MSELKRVHEWNEVAGNKFGDEKLFDLYVDLISEEFNELLAAQSLEEEADALGDLLVVVVGACHAKGFSAEAILSKVNDSNFSKFDETISDASMSVLAYDGDKRYENVRFEPVGDYFVIRGDKVGGASNKILKSHKFFEPDFSREVK